jgi:hypothetical protein
VLAGCEPPPLEPLPPDSFAFGVFGDGPYELWEQGRYRRVLADVANARIAWLIHIGDLFAEPCRDGRYVDRARELATVPVPVIYTPGDNEWTDCWTYGSDPLDRLAALRRIMFPIPDLSTGSNPLPLESQAYDPVFNDFPENVRWRRGGFVFATLHVVGSDNGLERFRGRTPASDQEAERRTRAALAWMAQTFDGARASGAKAVVLAFHAEVLEDDGRPREGYERFVPELVRLGAAFPGPVIAIHGDSHQHVVDRPFLDAGGRAVDNITRIETFGSPDIGWLRVVVDTVAGRLVRVEPRLMRGWW